MAALRRSRSVAAKGAPVLLAAVHSHLRLLVAAAMAVPAFDPSLSSATVRVGLADYAGDVRGIVEDALGKARNVRVAVPAFGYVPGSVDLVAIALATRPDGRIVVMFTATTGQKWLAQVLADGSGFDPAFAGGGFVTTPNSAVTGYYVRPALAVTSTGDIIAAYGCGTSSLAGDACIARLTPTGQFDPTWGTNGITDYNNGPMFSAVAVDSKGYVWLAGASVQAATTP
jgi:hypothetical protein